MLDTVAGDPASTQPGSRAVAQPVRNGEACKLVTELVGVRAVPGSRINAAEKRDVG